MRLLIYISIHAGFAIPEHQLGEVQYRTVGHLLMSTTAVACGIGVDVKGNHQYAYKCYICIVSVHAETCTFFYAYQ